MNKSEHELIAERFWNSLDGGVKRNDRERGSGQSSFAFVGLMLLDKPLVGTYDYMGRAYFWSMKYKHELRDATPSKRRRVHRMMLDAGLPVSGDSEQHDKIMEKVFGGGSK